VDESTIAAEEVDELELGHRLRKAGREQEQDAKRRRSRKHGDEGLAAETTYATSERDPALDTYGYVL
jgi:hypothetical protein